MKLAQQFKLRAIMGKQHPVPPVGSINRNVCAEFESSAPVGLGCRKGTVVLILPGQPCLWVKVGVK